MLTEDRYTEYDTWAWLYNQTMGPEYGKNQEKPLEIMLLSRGKTPGSLLWNRSFNPAITRKRLSGHRI